MRDRHAVWAMHKILIAQLKQSRIDRLLEAKIDINLAPLDHLLCLKTKCTRLTMEHLDEIVALRQQRPFKKLSDLKSIYGIGVKIVEELQKHLKHLPEEPVDEKDESVLYVPPSVYTVLMGGLSDQQSESRNGSRRRNESFTETTSSSDERSDCEKFSQYKLLCFTNFYKFVTSWRIVGRFWLRESSWRNAIT